MVVYNGCSVHVDYVCVQLMSFPNNKIIQKILRHV